MTFTMLGASFAGALIDAGSAASAVGGSEGGQGFNPLEVSPGLAVWSGVTFLILLFLLTKFAWKPIVAAVEAREHKLEGDLASAEKARADAEAAARKLAAELDAAALKAREMVEQARASAERVAAETAAHAKAEAEAARARETAAIKAEYEKALADIKEVAVDLAIAITREVVKKSASDDDHRKAAEEVVKAMTAKSKKGAA